MSGMLAQMPVKVILNRRRRTARRRGRGAGDCRTNLISPATLRPRIGLAVPRARGITVAVQAGYRALNLFGGPMKRLTTVTAILGAALLLVHAPLAAQDKGKTAAAELTAESQKALAALTAKVPMAKSLAAKATAVLVFPNVKKAGLGIGGQDGEGTLLKGGTAAAFYKTTGASFGLQAGGQQYGYAMFLMNQAAVAQLDVAKGFEVGVGPSIVMVDEGMGKSTTTTTLDKDIYAFIFSQKGLMAGLGIQGNKISKITPK